MIWNRVPKTYFIKYNQFTAARFNIGNLPTLMTYDKLYVERGYHTAKGCTNARRISRKQKKRKMVQRRKAGRLHRSGIVLSRTILHLLTAASKILNFPTFRICPMFIKRKRRGNCQNMLESVLLILI